jgi:hypothetical protein
MRSIRSEERLDKQGGFANSSIPQKSIAVLPFENLSDDKRRRLFRRRHSGRNPDEAGEHRRFESDLAHFHREIQEQA